MPPRVELIHLRAAQHSADRGTFARQPQWTARPALAHQGADREFELDARAVAVDVADAHVELHGVPVPERGRIARGDVAAAVVLVLAAERLGAHPAERVAERIEQP